MQRDDESRFLVDEIELLSLSGKKLRQLCDTFPKTGKVLQDYAIEQMRHLDAIRRKKEHLHPGNYDTYYYRKK